MNPPPSMDDHIIHHDDEDHASSSEYLFSYDPQITSLHVNQETLTFQHYHYDHNYAYYRPGDDATAIMMTPPTMHPNLVMTLKSILLASPESIGSPGYDGIPFRSTPYLSPNPPKKLVGNSDYGDISISRKKLHMTETSDLGDFGYAGNRVIDKLHMTKMSGDVGEFGYGDSGGTGKFNAKKKGDVDDFGYGNDGATEKLAVKRSGAFDYGDNTTPNKYKVKHDDDADDDVVPLELIQNKRPFTCSYKACLKTFKNPQTLKMHCKTHCKGIPGVRSPMTPSTDAQTTPPSLNVGSSVSSGVPSINSIGKAATPHKNRKKVPSKCPLCKGSFVGLYELRRHFGRKHSEGEKQHACRKCGKRFYVEVDVRNHEKLCGAPIWCQCGMKFAFKCNLMSRKRAHPECQNDDSIDVLDHSTLNYDRHHLGPSFGSLNIPLFPLPQFDPPFEPLFH